MPLRFRHAALALLTLVAGPALANISDDPLTARVSERSAAPIRLAQRGCPHGFDADIYGRCLPTGMVPPEYQAARRYRYRPDYDYPDYGHPGYGARDFYRRERPRRYYNDVY
jgi:hypothetical protein